MPELEREYHLLGLDISILSDSISFPDLFDRDFAWFAQEKTNGQRRLDVRLSAGGERAGGVLHIDDRSFVLGDRPDKDACAYLLVLRSIFSGLQDYLVLHAAVAARNGEATAISGPSGAGKTTLLLRLLDTGCSYLSDDFCPVHKETGLVHPFPRSLRVPKPLLHGSSIESLSPPAEAAGAKIVLDPVKLDAPVQMHPCRLRRLICLEPGVPSDSLSSIEVLHCGEEGDGFLEDLNDLEGVTVERPPGSISRVTIRFSGNHGSTGRLREVLGRHDEKIWSSLLVDDISPDFSNEPLLTRIPSHEAAFYLMRQIKQEQLFRPSVQGRQQKPGGLFVKIIELLRGVSSYRLRCGRLEAMVDLLMETISGARK